MHFGYYIAISLRYLCLFSNYDFNEKIFDITISITMFICAIHHLFKLGLLFLLYFDICFFFCISLCIYTQGIDNLYLPFACSTFSIKSIFVIIFVAIMNLLVTATSSLFSNDRRQN